MTVTNIDAALDARAPRRGEPQTVGQATAIEQSRAIAEVKAAVVVAQQCPRNVNAAVEMMRQSCAQPALASRAFFRYSRGGSQITGPSIHLARELARVWGNIQYGIKELRRDDKAGESEMLADAWDLQTNTRPSQTFIVKHKRDTKNGQKDLTDLRDIYENNANQGARRVREAIFAVLPPWFVEEAKELCMRTNEHGGGKPVAARIADAVKWFEGAGVRISQIEEKLGQKHGDWEAADVAQLELIARSLQAGETTTADEFPVKRASADDFKTAPEQPEKSASPVQPGQAEKPVTKVQAAKIGRLLADQGFTDVTEASTYLTRTVGRTVKDIAELSHAEADTAIAALEIRDDPAAGKAPANSETGQ